MPAAKAKRADGRYQVVNRHDRIRQWGADRPFFRALYQFVWQVF